MKIQPVRGTHDIFGNQIYKYRKLEKIVNQFAKLYCFNDIITPIFETSELFKKPLGEHSDVVLKEMYSFIDRNEDSLTLRPEHTTPILRASISNNFLDKLPQRLFTYGPVFRRERPQKGRYRQFNQINFETIGTHDILADCELIILADNILKKVFPNKKINLNINSLGDKETLGRFKNELSNYFDRYKNDLSQESSSKINDNPLRILDSKNPIDIKINQNSPKIYDFYSKETNKKFIDLQGLLSDVSVNYNVNYGLVRGLDYYCHTVFEFKTEELGSQDTIIGGGRYDGLIKILGGPDLPGVGWAGGIERILMLMEDDIPTNNTVPLILMSDSFNNYGLNIASELRKNNINIFIDYKYNIKKSLSVANKLNLNHALIIGETEYEKNKCTIKYLNENNQQILSIKEIIKVLAK